LTARSSRLGVFWVRFNVWIVSVAAKILARPTARGAPSVAHPPAPHPELEYRFRQPITVGHDTPTRSAISVFDTPSAMKPLRISVKRIPETSSGEEPELVLNLSFLVSSA
jgi:hypothetical protein